MRSLLRALWEVLGIFWDAFLCRVLRKHDAVSTGSWGIRCTRCGQTGHYYDTYYWDEPKPRGTADQIHRRTALMAYVIADHMIEARKIHPVRLKGGARGHQGCLG